jgi:probable F420-dependent oxidoreductase
MTNSIPLGMSLLPPAEVTGIERADWAEEHGFDSVWIPDGMGKMHALTLAAAVAARTSRVRICTGIVPVYTHTPAVLASSAMALAQLAPGRFVLGLGASSRVMMEDWHGLSFEKPLTRVRETTQVLRRMLAGEKVEFEGETLRTRGFRLAAPPPQPVPIYLAALRPKMLEMAGELADGVILHLAPREALPRMLEHVAAGAERSGRTLADLEIVCRYNVAVTEEREKGLAEARDFLVRYYSAPVYNKFLAWCGFEEAATRISEGFRSGDRGKTAAALDDEVVTKFCVVGTAEECRAEIAAYHAAGVNTPIINALSVDPAVSQASMEAFIPARFSP